MTGSSIGNEVIWKKEDSTDGCVVSGMFEGACVDVAVAVPLEVATEHHTVLGLVRLSQVRRRCAV
jgi:hypothetical protein